MDWEAPFIFYRIAEDGRLIPVQYSKDLKAAKYWLNYIAEPGDVCCRTPKHPSHSGIAMKPEYFSHKIKTGVLSTKEKLWKEYARSKNCNPEFPSEPEEIFEQT